MANDRGMMKFMKGLVDRATSPRETDEDGDTDPNDEDNSDDSNTDEDSDDASIALSGISSLTAALYLIYASDMVWWNTLIMNKNQQEMLQLL